MKYACMEIIIIIILFYAKYTNCYISVEFGEF